MFYLFKLLFFEMLRVYIIHIIIMITKQICTINVYKYTLYMLHQIRKIADFMKSATYSNDMKLQIA